MKFKRGPILIADDDRETREGLVEFLAQFGYEVAAAGNGQEAMDLLLGGVRPSLLIIDLTMPHVGGEDLSRYLLEDPELRHLPVVVVTGSPERLGRTAADAVLEKPVNLIALLNLVKRLTTGRRETPA
jgi:two-component system, cell cycle response regulator DivK